jgi:hypothetical protein
LNGLATILARRSSSISGTSSVDSHTFSVFGITKGMEKS